MTYSEDSNLTECGGSAEEYSKTKVQYMMLFFCRTGHDLSANLLKQKKKTNLGVYLFVSLNADASFFHTRSH